MKRRYILTGLMLATANFVMGQDTYLNDRITATDDVIGTARYVSMGGALGALGADLSVISSNPAGMALYRKNDFGFTLGAVIPNKAGGWNSGDMMRTYGENLPRAAFDQMGFVWAVNVDGPVLRYMTLGVNYQKKANYNLGFYADNSDLNELSQMDQLTELGQHKGYATDYNLAGLAYDYDYLQKDASGNVLNNDFSGERSRYTRHQRGSLQAFDINLAFNLNDRVYTGLTLGIDNVNYLSWSQYEEENSNTLGQTGDYLLYNDRKIEGVGVNVKWGIIFRPIEDSPFRIGLAAETPTWYRTKNSTLFELTDLQTNATTPTWESRLESTIRTPWRTRLSMGSTVDNVMAWGVEYEFANMGATKTGFPDWDADDPNHSAFTGTKDAAMNELTKKTLRGQHTLKAGVEVKPTEAFAIRAGYNFISNRFKKNPTFDQCYTNSLAMDYTTSTDFMTLGATNIATFGIGYRHKAFYADLSYKYRMQTGKFYAFDTSFTAPDSQFSADNPGLAGRTIDPVDVELNRHQVMMSLGFKF